LYRESASIHQILYLAPIAIGGKKRAVASSPPGHILGTLLRMKNASQGEAGTGGRMAHQPTLTYFIAGPL